jgi:CheY-like chemotaxis protein
VTGKARVLFVDDDEAVLKGLRLVTRGLRARWEMEFVTGGVDALSAMRIRRFDVVVSDLRMPGMDGAALLDRVHAEFPSTVRIVLSGYAEPDVLERARRVAHTMLAKPCAHLELCAAIERSMG